jgi:rRNA biogenesis protein RRP5
MTYKDIKEKMNLYLALMNLEKKYGNESTQEKVFKEALLYCDKETIYINQALVHAKNNDIKSADELYQKMIVKFKFSIKIWESYLKFLIEKDVNDENINLVYQKGLSKFVIKDEKINLGVKYAMLLYKNNSVIEGIKMNNNKIRT